MIYLQGLIILVITYFIVSNYIKHDDLLDIEGFFDKLFHIEAEKIFPNEIENAPFKSHNFKFNNPNFHLVTQENDPTGGFLPEGPIVTYDFDNDSEIFPWADVNACINKQINYEFIYPKSTENCPKCNKKPENLHWIFFQSPVYAWQQLLGTEGYMSICTECNWQVDYFCTGLN